MTFHVKNHLSHVNLQDPPPRIKLTPLLRGHNYQMITARKIMTSTLWRASEKHQVRKVKMKEGEKSSLDSLKLRDRRVQLRSRPRRRPSRLLLALRSKIHLKNRLSLISLSQTVRIIAHKIWRTKLLQIDRGCNSIWRKTLSTHSWWRAR